MVNILKSLASKYSHVDRVEAELLRGFSLSAKELASLAREMITPGRADNNLRAVGAAEVLEILSEASPQLSHQM